MRHFSLRLLCMAAALFGMSAAQAVVILNDASTGYYNNGLGTSLDTFGASDPFPCANVACGDAALNFPAAPNLSAAAGALGSWLTNSAPTGGAWSAAPQAIPGTWAVNAETAIVYAIDAGSGLSGLNLRLGVDNGIFVWLNGNYLFGARAAGGSTLGEYVRSLPDLSGLNYLQILREDHGGATGYAIELTGTVVAVAEPSVLALFAFGLFALAYRRRISVGKR